MLRNDEDLSETDIRSPRARMLTVRAEEQGDGRSWVEEAHVCRLLEAHRIVHLGVGWMPSPFEIVRTALGGSYFLSCFGGQGEVLIDGSWEGCGEGQAFLLSPGTLHAFRAVEGSSWNFCWVRFREIAGQKPIASASSPVLTEFAAQPFLHAVSGLYHSSAAPVNQASSIAMWVELLQRYVLDFAQPPGRDARLARVWEAVERDLSANWSSAAMAKIAHVSEKQLERLCKRDLGRTPRQHLITLRMYRAAEMLTATDETIGAIAAAVGYENPFTFSNRFRRFSGWPPSRYPGRGS